MDIERLEDLRKRLEYNSELEDEEIENLWELIDEAIAHQSETEMVVCPDCRGSGVYQEYDEYDRYHVYTCCKCEGTGEIARQTASEKVAGERAMMNSEKALKNIGDWISKETESRKYPKSELLELSESLQALKAAIARQSETSDEVAEAIEALRVCAWGNPDMSKQINLGIVALEEHQPWIPVSERLPTDGTPVLITYVGFNDGKFHSDGVATWSIEENGYNGGWLWEIDGSEATVEITHWKPLPEPPKGE